MEKILLSAFLKIWQGAYEYFMFVNSETEHCSHTMYRLTCVTTVTITLAFHFSGVGRLAADEWAVM